ncbi:hypothetical protein [Jidongwangia harbinensis]|uniref:hypothetical protein n=1 Tax=Jidongwangia harbinensis TaxID=2878561 RepID=UPI001CD9FB11|nr:hypothetical protein [Jidongwangia harbinensis]MCA2213213.1 hypothetical protein [Jidongwangia harbinensis]
MDLERLFAVSSTPAITSNTIFTNRVDEMVAFESAIRGLQVQRREHPRLTEDLRTGRDNVLVFYGMGGIGKSTLSRELQRRFDAGEVPVPERRVSARIDFANLSTFDPEVMLLRLRRCLGQLTGELHAFDLAFSTYWERKHPGQPLAEFLDRRSTLNSINERTGMSEHIQSGLDAFLGGAGLVGAAWRLGTLIKDGLVAKVEKAAVLRDCPYFEPLLNEPSPDLARLFLPVLLAWDLERYQREHDAAVVIFLDTWEMVQAHRREPHGVEDALSRLVYLMPNVLFVITGRSQVTWAEPERAVDLKYAGPECWPGLDLSGALRRQWLLGALSEEDCERYLTQRLQIDGAPAIPAAIRRRIVAGSEGLPLYLDLSAEHFDGLAGRGEPRAEDFGTTLPHLVTRVVRDLDSAERQLLRAAALVSAFNRDLLHAAVPDYRDATIHRFMARHFVKQDRSGWLEYSMHDTLRSSIREHDAVSGDPWSDQEWNDAATRTVEFLRTEIADDVGQGAHAYRSRLVEAFLDAACLSLEFSIPADWLLDVGKAMCDLGQWQVLQRLETLSGPEGSVGRPIVLGCMAAYSRDAASLPRALELLDAASAEPGLSEYVTVWLELERAEVLVRLDRNDDASPLLVRLARRSDTFGDRARRWLAILDERAGRFPAVLGWASGLSSQHPRLRRAAATLTGFTLLANADLDRAVEQFRLAVDISEPGRSLVEDALVREHLAWCRAWRGGAEARALAAEALEVNRRMGSPIGVGRALAACALADIGAAEPAEVFTRTRESLAVIRRTGYQSDGLHPLLAELLLHCLLGDVPAATDVHGQILALITTNRTHFSYTYVATWWLSTIAPSGHVSTAGFEPVAWLDGEDNARRRWLAVLARRREIAA